MVLESSYPQLNSFHFFKNDLVKMWFICSILYISKLATYCKNENKSLEFVYVN